MSDTKSFAVPHRTVFARVISIWWSLILITIPFSGVQAADPLQQLTGAQTRVVWIQDHSPRSNDILATGQRLKLMGYDSLDGQGERALLNEVTNYAKPLFSPDGQQVIFSSQKAQKFYVVNWNGEQKKLLGNGLAVDVWRDPQTGIDWVYFARRVGRPEKVTYRNLQRLRLDNPKVIQDVWSLTEIGCDNFQLTADGSRAAGEFPWPNGGVADLVGQKWIKYEEGCWASIAPDNSGLAWVFDGPHRNLQMRRPDQSNSWRVAVNTAPNINGAEVFHPRWSNHVRYLVMTGPFNVKGPVNMISGGGPQVEIHVGRFAADFRSVETWHQVTSNTRGDFYPDIWIAGGETSTIELPGLVQSSPVASSTWPAFDSGLEFAWNNSRDSNQLPADSSHPQATCKMQFRGRSFPGHFHDLRFEGGEVLAEELGPRLSSACRKSSELTLEMLITVDDTTHVNEQRFLEWGSSPALNLRLSQHGEHLQWATGKLSGLIEKPVFAPGDPSHLTFVWTQDQLRIYHDGKLISEVSVAANFSRWTSAPVFLGGPEWHGTMESIAAYSRSLSPREVETEFQTIRSRVRNRKPPTRLQITARCRERSHIPAPAEILPYRRALVLHDFEVESVRSESGASRSADLGPGKRILIAQWAILDGAPLADAASPAIGESASFAIESLAEHPELTSERQLLDTEEIDLPIYYRVASSGSSPDADQPKSSGK